MTNQPDRLDALLDLAEANTQLVINAAEERPELPERNEVWWPYLIQCFGGDDALFERLRWGGGIRASGTRASGRTASGRTATLFLQ